MKPVPSPASHAAPPPVSRLGEARTRLAGRRRQFAAILVLGKPGVVALLMFVALVSSLVTAHGRPTGQAVLLLVASGWLAASGAAAVNQYLERDVDRLMTRTMGRPLVTGEIRSSPLVAEAGIALIVLALALALLVNQWLPLFVFLGALVYVAVYTVWLKRRSPWNVVVGGLTGSCAVLAGAAATGPWWEPAPLLIALLLFFWTPPHFWSLAIYRFEDYRRAAIPMLPVVVGPRRASQWILASTVLLAGSSLALVSTRALGPAFAVAAGAGGAAFLAAALYLAVHPTAHAARFTFRVSLAYLALLFAAMLLDAI